MRYKTKRCPYCKYIYYSDLSHIDLSKGSPFITCPLCKQEFLDKDIKELAFEPYNESEFSIGKCFLRYAYILLFAIAMLLCAIFDQESKILGLVMSIVGFAGYIYCVYDTIKNLDNIKETYKKDYKASENRLSDVYYIIKLEKAGIEVPINIKRNAIKIYQNKR